MYMDSISISIVSVLRTLCYKMYVYIFNRLILDNAAKMAKPNSLIHKYKYLIFKFSIIIYYDYLLLLFTNYYLSIIIVISTRKMTIDGLELQQID